MEAATHRDMSPRTAAKLAGAALVAMAALAMFANFFVLQNMAVAGDATETASRILADAATFRVGIVVWVLIGVLDVVVALALYVVFKPVNRSLSLLAAWFRLIYTAVFIAGMQNFLAALRILGDAEYLKAFDAPQLNSQVMLSLDAFQDTWVIGLVLFGVHLGLLGYLAYRSGYVPKVFGVLLLLASASYLVDNVAKIAFSGYGGGIAMAVAVPAFVGELALAVWLLVRSKAVPDELAS